MRSPSLRLRILLTLLPPFALLALLGGAGVTLLANLGRRSDAILRENYDSVRAMARLQQAAERVERSPRHADASAWADLLAEVEVERRNVTIVPEEPRLFAELEDAVADYREAVSTGGAGADPRADPRADEDLAGRNRRVRQVAAAILELNQGEMERASAAARRAAGRSLWGFAAAFAVAALSALLAGWWLARTVLAPIESLTEAVESIGAGQLHRTVPVLHGDELGRLARSFNAMSGQVREFRRSKTQTLMRAQQTAQAAIDSFPDPVLVLDPEGRVELTNTAARHLFGAAPDPDGPPGDPWVAPEALREPIREALLNQRPYLTERFEQTFAATLDGVEKSFLLEVRPIRDAAGDTMGACVVLNDVTRFRVLDQLKGDFVATASHELKTPLTGLRLALHVLLEETVGPLTPKQTELLLDARDNAERLLAMVEQLLSLARLEDDKGGLHPVATPVRDLLQAALDTVVPRAADRRIRVTLEDAGELPPVLADPDRVARALDNLLTNAVSHTPPGGTITLSAARESGFVRLTVGDTGAGVPAEALPHLFEKFYRVPGDERPAGSGLGLAIVRETAEAHGGTARARSSPGAGSAFSFTLPVAGGRE